MRIISGLLALLLIAAGGAWYFGFRGEERPPVVAKTRAAIAQAGNVGLEKAADYWLSAADQRQAENNPQGSGTALAIAIRLGRLEAIRAGAKPVPDGMKRRFKGHYSEALLDEARWTVAEPDSRLGRVLARWPVKEGAVTLGDVIVFKTRSAARNRRLFAHELVHVDQYRKLGINTFARRYAENPDPIEEEARTKARRVVRML